MDLVIFIGLQASGKTTFYHQRFAATHDYVSKDQMRNVRRRETRQHELVGVALAAGRSVVVDNTNSRRADRTPLIEIGRRHEACIVGYYFRADVRACLERNRKRAGRARVPDVAILATRKRLELPSYDEGFDALHYVELLGDGRFDLRDWSTSPPRVKTAGK